MSSPFNPNTAGFFAILKRTYVCTFSDWTTRATRCEYWLGYLGCILIFILASLVLALIGALMFDHVDHADYLSFFGVALLLVAVLAGLSVRCLQVRRLHDIGRSGLWLIPLIVLEAIPGIAVVAWAGEIILGCIDSQAGKNAWGISPKHRDGLPPVPSVAAVLPTVRMKRTKPTSAPPKV